MQYSGPAVLPWLWQPVEHDGEVVLLPQAISHIAGSSGEPRSLSDCMQMARGATLMCCVVKCRSQEIVIASHLAIL